MQTLIKSLLLVVTLISCSTDDSRYRDISQLERPPTLPADPSYRPNDTYALDSSRIEKRTTTAGLEDKVTLTSAKPLQIRIKMPVDKAWYALAQALKQSDFKITDYDRDKKIYYISSGKNADGFFSFLSSDKKIYYVLSMKGAGNETAVMANLAAASEQSGNADNTDDDTAEQVLRTLYGILHDDLTLDYNGS